MFLSSIVAESILLIQLVWARFNHVNEIGERFFLFNRYRLEMFHYCLSMDVVNVLDSAWENYQSNLILYLHRPIVLYSYQVVLILYSVSYSDVMCLLAIDRDQPRANRYLFRCCHLQIPFFYALYERTGFALCESHICICDGPKNSIQLLLNYGNFDAVVALALTFGSIFSFRRLVVTVFCIRLLYDALPAAFPHRSLSSIKQHIWSVGPLESSSPVLKPLFIAQFFFLQFQCLQFEMWQNFDKSKFLTVVPPKCECDHRKSLICFVFTYLYLFNVFFLFFLCRLVHLNA